MTKRFLMTHHALTRLAERWPDTVLRPRGFSFFEVRADMPTFGYARGALYYAVPNTPMVAVVQDDRVLTVHERTAADQLLRLRGYHHDELYRDGHVA